MSLVSGQSKTSESFNQKSTLYRFHFKKQLNLRTLKVGGITSYIFSKKFSYHAIVSQREKQLKSAGSFMPNFLFYYTDYNLEAEGINEDTY
jgi:hypothetical protein